MTAGSREAEAMREDRPAGQSARAPGGRDAEAAARPCDVGTVLEALHQAAAVHDREIAEAGLLSCASAMDA